MPGGQQVAERSLYRSGTGKQRRNRPDDEIAIGNEISTIAIDKLGVYGILVIIPYTPPCKGMTKGLS